MACCLTAPSHYLNQCWIIIRCFVHKSNTTSAAGELDILMCWVITLLKGNLLPHILWASDYVLIQLQRMAAILQTTFPYVSSWIKSWTRFIFHLKFVPWNPIDNKLSIIHFQCQVIFWSNVDPDLWCHMASLGHNELTHAHIGDAVVISDIYNFQTQFGDHLLEDFLMNAAWPYCS